MEWEYNIDKELSKLFLLLKFKYKLKEFLADYFTPVLLRSAFISKKIVRLFICSTSFLPSTLPPPPSHLQQYMCVNCFNSRGQWRILQYSIDLTTETMFKKEKKKHQCLITGIYEVIKMDSQSLPFIRTRFKGSLSSSHFFQLNLHHKDPKCISKFSQRFRLEHKLLCSSFKVMLQQLYQRNVIRWTWLPSPEIRYLIKQIRKWKCCLTVDSLHWNFLTL